MVPRRLVRGEVVAVSRHQPAELVWAVPVLCGGAVIVGAAVVVRDQAARHAAVGGDVLGGALVAVTFSVVGALLAVRVRRNPIGWLFCLVALSGATSAASTLLASSRADALPQRWAAWTGSWMSAVGMTATAMALLVLPDGRLLSRRWRPVVGLLVVAASVLLAGEALSPELSAVDGRYDNPIGVAAFANDLVANGGVGWPLMSVVFVAGCASLVMRFRRGTPVARQQLKVVLAAASMTVVGAVATTVLYGGPVVPFALAVTVAVLGVALLPVAVAVAVLRYRLFDVDRFIRRSVVYGVLSTAVALVYLVVAAVPGVVVGDRLPVAYAVGVTIVATLGFQRVRRSVDRLVGRLIFGERPSDYELLTSFGTLLEQTFDLDELAPRVAATVREGLELDWARVRLTALDDDSPDLVVGSAGGATDHDEAAHAVALVHGGEPVGVIECGGRDGAPLNDADLALLDTIARQAALGVRNARLAGDLARRLEEIRVQADDLAASRARIVEAHDTERRRLERDIHDGVQQDVVALLMQVRIARNTLRSPDVSADVVLGGLQADVVRVLDELREVAHGIHPPVLADRGLLDAVEARAARLPVGIRIDAPADMRGRRFDPNVEAAAYFVISEALTNAVKHASCSTITVSLARDDTALRIAVVDDGNGFEPSLSNGFGITGMRDRIEVFGGALTITSEPLQGTTVRAVLPVGPSDPDA